MPEGHGAVGPLRVAPVAFLYLEPVRVRPACRSWMILPSWPEARRPGREARRVLAYRRESLKRGANLGRHVAELPADLVFDGSWSVGVSETSSSDCVGGGTQGVRTHMADGDGLTGGPRRGHCRRSFQFVRADATGKATADPVRSARALHGRTHEPGR